MAQKTGGYDDNWASRRASGQAGKRWAWRARGICGARVQSGVHLAFGVRVLWLWFGSVGIAKCNRALVPSCDGSGIEFVSENIHFAKP